MRVLATGILFLSTLSPSVVRADLECPPVHPESTNAFVNSIGTTLIVRLGSPTVEFSCPTPPQSGSSVRCTQSQDQSVPQAVTLKVGENGSGDLTFAPTPGGGQIPPLSVSCHLACPQQITLGGAQFINHELFPTDAQIETNFNQSIQEQGSHLPVWDREKLEAAQRFVHAIAANYRNGQVVLKPRAGADSCGGTFAGIPYSVLSDTVRFALIESAEVNIGTGTNSPVTFQAFLASNCSGCSSTAELFQFQRVTALGQ